MIWVIASIFDEVSFLMIIVIVNVFNSLAGNISAQPVKLLAKSLVKSHVFLARHLVDILFHLSMYQSHKRRSYCPQRHQPILDTFQAHC
jgi:hypothetical protein